MNASRNFALIITVIGACGHESFGSTATTGSSGSTGSTASTGSSGLDESMGPGSDPAASSSTGGDEASGTTTGSSGDDTSSTGSTSTGPAAPVCGDGVVDPGETCDDANEDPGDGCKQSMTDLRVFVTSQVWQGGKIGSLYLADQRCRMLAAIAELPNFGTYRAWLSDSKASAAERHFHSPGRYILVNGLVVADDWTELTSGKLQNPINVTESSQTSQVSPVWTGTLPSGEAAGGVTFCADWTVTGNKQMGGRGVSSQINGLWTFLEHDDCGGEAALYCFEQPPKP